MSRNPYHRMHAADVAVRIARGTKTRIAESYGSFTIQVLEASDPEASFRALSEAARRIADLDAGWESADGLRPGDRNDPSYVSPVTQTPDGPFVYIDGGHVPPKMLATIPEIVKSALEEVGVESAVVTVPQGGQLAGRLWQTPRAVILRLLAPRPPSVYFARPRPGRLPVKRNPVVPDSWIKEAVAWVKGDLPDDHPIRGSIVSVDLRVPASDGGLVVRQARKSSSSWKLVSGDLDEPIRAAGGMFLGPGNLNLGFGGSESTDDDLLTAYEALREIARKLAGEAAYAYIEFDPTFKRLCDLPGGWRIPGSREELVAGMLRSGYMAGAISTARDVCDQVAFDAFPYQILGPGHLERLGGPPEGARPLEGGRVELEIGDPAAWMPIWPTREYLLQNRSDLLSTLPKSPTREEILAIGREILAPCLVDEDETLSLQRARPLYPPDGA